MLIAVNQAKNTPCKVIWIPESRELWRMESGTQKMESYRNPTLWNPISRSRNLEIQENRHSGIQNPLW